MRSPPPTTVFMSAAPVIAVLLAAYAVAAEAGGGGWVQLSCRVAGSSDYILDVFYRGGSMAFVEDVGGVRLVVVVDYAWGPGEPRVTVESVERVNDSVLVVRARLVGSVWLHYTYFVNGDVSVYVERVNSSWARVSLVLEGLDGAPPGVSYMRDELLLVESLAPGAPVHVDRLNVTFLVSLADGSAYQVAGGGVERVGGLPFLRPEAFTPRRLAGLVAENARRLLLSIVEQRYRLEQIAESVLVETEEGVVLNETRLREIVREVYESIMPSFTYYDSVCRGEVSVDGFFTVVCTAAGEPGYRVAYLDPAMVNAEALLEAVERGDLDAAAETLAAALRTSRLLLANVTGGSTVAIARLHPVPRSVEDMPVMLVEALRGRGLLYTAPSRGEALEDWLAAVRELLESINAGGEFNYTYLPAERLLLVETNDTRLTMFLWPRDLNGTDRFCIYSRGEMAVELRDAMRAWDSPDARLLAEFAVNLTGRIWRIMLAAVEHRDPAQAREQVETLIRSPWEPLPRQSTAAGGTRQATAPAAPWRLAAAAAAAAAVFAAASRRRRR